MRRDWPAVSDRRAAATIAAPHVRFARADRDAARRRLAEAQDLDPSRLGFHFLAVESVLRERETALRAAQQVLRRVAGVERTWGSK